MSAETVSSELDIFAPKPVQSAILGTTQVTYKPTGGVEPSDLEFVVPADNDTYIDVNIHLYVKGKLTKADGTGLDAADFTAGTNNLLKLRPHRALRYVRYVRYVRCVRYVRYTA
jgi:hypothetical protein